MDNPLILVVEDEVDVAEYIADTIKSTKRYDVVVAHNGIEALEQLNKHKRFLGLAENRIKCIILDLKMPEMDGLQFIKRFRREEPFYKLMPIIILTAFEDREKWSVTTSSEVGNAAAYLKKPFSGEELIDAIGRALKGELGHMIDETREKKYKKLDEFDLEEKKKSAKETPKTN